MKVITRIKLLPLGKILGIIGAILGLLVTLIGVVAIKIINPEDLIGATASEVLLAVITSIIIWGIIGFIIGIIFAFLYNLITRYTKGIEIELK